MKEEKEPDTHKRDREPPEWTPLSHLWFDEKVEALELWKNHLRHIMLTDKLENVEPKWKHPKLKTWADFLEHQELAVKHFIDTLRYPSCEGASEPNMLVEPLYETAPFDVKDKASVKILLKECEVLIKLLSGTEEREVAHPYRFGNDVSEIYRRILGNITSFLLMRDRKKNYENNQGANSKEIGEENLKRATNILKQFGGIEGYDSIKTYGGKKEIRQLIMNKCKYADERQAYNCLRKLKKRVTKD